MTPIAAGRGSTHRCGALAALLILSACAPVEPAAPTAEVASGVDAATRRPATHPPAVGPALYLLRRGEACTLERRDEQGTRILAAFPLRNRACGGPLSISAQGDVVFLHGQKVWWLPRRASSLWELPKPRDAADRPVTPRLAALTTDGRPATLEIIEEEGAAGQPDVHLRAWTWTEDAWQSSPPRPARLLDGLADLEIDPVDLTAFGLYTDAAQGSLPEVQPPEGAAAWFTAAHPAHAGMACVGLPTGALCGGEEGDDALSLVPPLAVFTPTGRVDLAAGPGSYPLVTLRAEEGRLYLQRNDLLLERFALPTGQRLPAEPKVERYALTVPATP